MRTRGRHSTQEMSTVISVKFGQRPEPPDELTDHQAKIWRATVASEPAEFFDTAALRGLLVNFCRQCQTADDLSAAINQLKPETLADHEGAKHYQRLTMMRDAATRASVSIARSLRLTNQSRQGPKRAERAARQAAKGAKPWD